MDNKELGQMVAHHRIMLRQAIELLLSLKRHEQLRWFKTNIFIPDFMKRILWREING
jgi:hypothetical protein